MWDSYLSVFQVARRFSEEEAILRRKLLVEPENPQLHLALTNCLRRQGRTEEAIEAYLRSLELRGTPAEEVETMRRNLSSTGLAGFVRNRLEVLLAQREKRYVPNFMLAHYWARVGDADEAVAWLERAIDAREPLVVWTRWSADFDLVRDDPRFGELIARIGLPDLRTTQERQPVKPVTTPTSSPP
jgi:tetratricopeptide (TPR) repeat protein